MTANVEIFEINIWLCDHPCKRRKSGTLSEDVYKRQGLGFTYVFAMIIAGFAGCLVIRNTIAMTQNIKLRYFASVSYTHLDVYKRQKLQKCYSHKNL